MSELDSLTTMLSGMGNPVPATPVAAPETKPEETATPAPAGTPLVPETPAATAPAAAPAPEAPTDPEQIFSGNKQNQAFAQMRVQNKQFSTVITRMGQILGIQDLTDPEKLVGALEQKFLEYESKEKQIPLPYLQQAEADRTARLQLEQENFRTQATLGFQKVKDTFQLDNAGLTEFARQLDAQGINPYLQPTDLQAAYRTLNYDKILQKETDKAVQEALARQKKAENQGSTPSTMVGKPPESGQPISTVAGLNQLLAGMGSK